MEALCLRLPRKTRKAKVTCPGATLMMLGYDVVDLEGEVEISLG